MQQKILFYKILLYFILFLKNFILYIFFFSFFSETKNIYFKYFFIVLHTIKPRKNSLQHTIFFFISSSLPTPFFFIIFLFHFVSPTGRPKNYIYNFFSLSSRTNKFIKIYFFSNFTHCKTLEKIFSTSFFFHLILEYLPKIFQPPKVFNFSYAIYQAYKSHNS